MEAVEASSDLVEASGFKPGKGGSYQCEASSTYFLNRAEFGSRNRDPI